MRRCSSHLSVWPIAITEMKIRPTMAMAMTILLPSSSAGMISNSSLSIVLDSKRKRSRTKIAFLRELDDVAGAATVRAFLIADIRGYTSFTRERGYEEAARLTARFAELTREVVGAGGGRTVELRGDEALCVFDSPRQALRASVALQQRFADAIREDPALPMRVGSGSRRAKRLRQRTASAAAL